MRAWRWVRADPVWWVLWLGLMAFLGLTVNPGLAVAVLLVTLGRAMAVS